MLMCLWGRWTISDGRNLFRYFGQERIKSSLLPSNRMVASPRFQRTPINTPCTTHKHGVNVASVSLEKFPIFIAQRVHSPGSPTGLKLYVRGQGLHPPVPCFYVLLPTSLHTTPSSVSCKVSYPHKQKPAGFACKQRRGGC